MLDGVILLWFVLAAVAAITAIYKLRLLRPAAADGKVVARG
jgi:hypothetical protein